jgi:3-hydroxyacyl-CoA dehydrogenase/enoyl-CoA hydratase/3-hydroxybutyryl-CoA epimerase
VLDVLVDGHGRHGRKNGRGFYDYDASGPTVLWSGLWEVFGRLDRQPGIDEVKERILFAQLAEGARCFAEGVLTSAADGDLGATLGVGFPAHLGGPFSAIDQLGAGEFVATADKLAAEHGPAFEPPDLLRAMATEGLTFHGASAVPCPGRRG